MKINPQIATVLQEYNIPVADGMAYLLSIFFNCRPSYTPPLLVQRMNVTNILGIDSNREVIWHIPLFTDGDAVDKWKWVLEWNLEFKRINTKRVAVGRDAITRMKAFFADNPDVRKEEVIEATKMYFKTLTSPDYLISSHYFISKGVGRDRTSALLGWIEKYREAISDTSANDSVDITSKMQ
jgi:hypothetical protein